MNTTARVAQVVADASHDGGQMMWSWNGGWIWILMPIMMTLVVAAIAAAVVWGVRSSRQPPRVSNRAEEILAERYARGKITGEEYRERLDGLQ